MRTLKKAFRSTVPCKTQGCKGKITIIQGWDLAGECPVWLAYNHITPSELRANVKEQFSLECGCNTCGGRTVIITDDVELVK